MTDIEKPKKTQQTNTNENLTKQENNTFKINWQKVQQQFKKPAIYLPTLIIALVVIVSLSVLHQIQRGRIAGSKASPLDIFNLKNSVKTAVSGLDGLRYPEADANRHALGLMIENHPDSRPQFGLTDASIVYEAQAEGGITRFLAVFGPKLPPKVGPVRSARTYYLDWCLEYDCFYGHVGGNIDALDLIPKIGIKDLDQFRYGVKSYNNAYYRVPKKGIALEHTMFADPVKLYKIASDNNWPATGEFPAVDFKNEAKVSDRGGAQTIDITISSRLFNTSWSYDPTTNLYKRSQGGQAHVDGATGQQIASSVLIVQEVPARVITTRINESGLAMNTIGTGKATVFQDGQRIDGTWKKTSQTERTIYSDANGTEIRVNRGQRWITIVDPGSAVSVAGSTTASPTNSTASLASPN